MHFSGRYVIPAPPSAVWAALNDAEILKSCIAGCEALEKTGPTTFTGSAKFKIGPVSATFRGKVEMTELDPPRRCVLKGEGQGGVAGFARGESEILLAPESEGTALSYVAKATVGGRLAQVGQRLLDGAARQLANEFFARFAAHVTSDQVASTSVPQGEEATVPQVLHEISDTPLAREGLAPEIWVVGLIAVIVILLLLFGLVL